MARDTIVRWRPKAVPTQDELRTLLEDYLRGIATDLEWRIDRFFVTLPGAPSFPYQRVGPSTEAARGAWLELAKESDGSSRPRWFEVWPGEDDLFVMTRDMDPVTTAIADRFASLAAHGWGGRVVIE